MTQLRDPLSVFSEWSTSTSSTSRIGDDEEDSLLDPFSVFDSWKQEAPVLAPTVPRPEERPAAPVDRTIERTGIFSGPGSAGREAVTPVDAGLADEDIRQPGSVEAGFRRGLTESNPRMMGFGLEALSRVIPESTDPALQGTGAKVIREYVRGIAPEALRWGAEKLKSFKADPSVATRRGPSTLAGIETGDDAIRFLGETFGEGLASTVPTIVAGAIGLKLAGPVGAYIGASVPAYLLNTGELYEQLIEAGADEQSASEWAVGGSVLVSALDVAGLGGAFHIASKAVRKQAIKSIADKIIQAGGIGGLSEGVTEGLQTLVQFEIVEEATGKVPTSEERIDAVATSVVGGFLVGGVLGGAAGVAGIATSEVEEQGTETTERPDTDLPAAPVPGQEIEVDEDSQPTGDANVDNDPLTGPERVTMVDEIREVATKPSEWLAEHFPDKKLSDFTQGDRATVVEMIEAEKPESVPVKAPDVPDSVPGVPKTDDRGVVVKPPEPAPAATEPVEPPVAVEPEIEPEAATEPAPAPDTQIQGATFTESGNRIEITLPKRPSYEIKQRLSDGNWRRSSGNTYYTAVGGENVTPEMAQTRRDLAAELAGTPTAAAVQGEAEAEALKPSTVEETVPEEVPASMTKLAKEVQDITRRMEGLHKRASSRAQATTREANLGKLAQSRDAKRDALTRLAREALVRGERLSPQVSEAVGSAIDYDERGEYAPVEQPEVVPVVEPDVVPDVPAEAVETVAVKPTRKLSPGVMKDLVATDVEAIPSADLPAFRANLQQYLDTAEVGDLPDAFYKGVADPSASGRVPVDPTLAINVRNQLEEVDAREDVTPQPTEIVADYRQRIAAATTDEEVDALLVEAAGQLEDVPSGAMLLNRLERVERAPQEEVTPIEQGAEADEIREHMGSTRELLDAYSPNDAVRKSGRQWTYDTVTGASGMAMFDTKREAVAAAEFHLALKEDQHAKPSSFTSIIAVRATKRLAIMKKLMGEGMSEIDAGKQARREIPDEATATPAESEVVAEPDVEPETPSGGAVLGSPSQAEPTAASAGATTPDEIEQAKVAWQEQGTESPWFKRWFGESKVLDDSGAPLVVYHGTTDAEIEAFDLTLTGRRTGNEYRPGGAAFFTSSAATASSYAAAPYRDIHPLDRPNVIPTYLSMQNPLEIDADGRSYVSVSEDAINRAREAGNDGVVIRNVLDHASAVTAVEEGPIDVFVVFKPEQIKSAIGNRGTFDPGDPSILGSPQQDEPTSTRQIVATTPESTKLSTNRPQILKALEDVVIAAGSVVPIRVGHISQRSAAGIFKVEAEVIRLRQANNIPTAAHEVAHALEKAVYGAGNTWKNPIVTGPMQKELVRLGKDLYPNGVPVGGYKSEGWAEFIKFYLTDEAIAQRKAPALMQWFVDDFLVANPEVSKALDESKRQITEYYAAEPQQRVGSQIARNPTLTQRLKILPVQARKARHSLMYNWVEMGTSLDHLVREYEYKTGETLAPAENPYKLYGALRGSHSRRVRYMIEDAMVDIAGNKVGAPLADAMAIIRPKEQKAFEEYLYARRARALLTDPQGVRDPGITLADAFATIKALETPQFVRAADIVYEFEDGVLDYFASASPTFAAIAKRFRARDPGDYISLNREIEEQQAGGGGGGTHGAPGGRLKGSGLRILSPTGSIIRHADMFVRAAHKRIVLDAVIGMSKVEGMGKLVEKIPVDKVPKQFMVEHDKLLRQIAEQTGIDMSELEQTDTQMIALTFFEPKTIPGKNIIPVVNESGTVEWFQVDPSLYEILQSMDVYRLPKAVDIILGAPARLMRAGTTGMRASFSLVTNPIRDPQSMVVHSRASASAPRLYAAWAASMGEALVGRVGYKTEFVDLFERLSVDMSQPLGQDINQTERAGRKLFQGRVIRYFDPRNQMDFYRDMIQFPESAPRIAEMKMIARDIGWKPGDTITMDQAVEMTLAGKQITTDFSAAGRYARGINRVVPFHNASIQGPRVTLRRLKENPVHVVFRAITNITVPTLIMWWKIKDEPWYQELNYREMFSNWHVPWGDDDDDPIIRIPRAFEIGAIFAAAVEAGLNSWYRDDPEVVKKLFSFLGEVAAPPIVPNIIEEYMEQKANWDDYWQMPIVPQWELQNTPASEQFGPYTTRAAIEIGKITGWSPRRIDHAVGGIAGGVGRDIMALAGRGPTGTSGEDREKEESDLPVIGRLFLRGGKSTPHSRSTQKVYDLAEEAQKQTNSTRNPETESQRQRRLLLDDGTEAITKLSRVRSALTTTTQRNALSVEIRNLAREITEVAEDSITEEIRAKFAGVRWDADKRFAAALPEQLSPDEKRRSVAWFRAMFEVGNQKEAREALASLTGDDFDGYIRELRNTPRPIKADARRTELDLYKENVKRYIKKMRSN